jgi:hypothetical protein
MDIRLTVAGDGNYDAYTLTDRARTVQLCGMTGSYIWTETDMPGTTPSDFWVVLTSADGTETIVFWQGGDAETVQYSAGGETT